MTRFLEYIVSKEFEPYLVASSAHHGHLCPRQVLGIRIGIAGAQAIGLEIPREDKRLLVIAETDGCFLDGLSAVTGAAVGHRTLRIEDQGKVAATFIDTISGEAYRVAPQLNIRENAGKYAGGEKRKYFSMLVGYQQMPDEELLKIAPVTLSKPVTEIISHSRIKEICSDCGEEIFNDRQIERGGNPYCLGCEGQGYYRNKAAAKNGFKNGT